MAEAIKVLIADDHEMVRRGLRTFLELHEDMEVVGEAADSASLLSAVRELQPDVILLDLKMPGPGAVPTLRQLAARQPGAGVPPRVLIVTSFTDRAEVLPVVREGVAGLVFKDIDPGALASAIRMVHAGHVLLPPEIAAALSEPDQLPAQLAALTPREREVLAQIAHGRSNREIAKALFLAEKTVKTHVSSILLKLGVADRTQAALYAVRHGVS